MISFTQQLRDDILGAPAPNLLSVQHCGFMDGSLSHDCQHPHLCNRLYGGLHQQPRCVCKSDPKQKETAIGGPKALHNLFNPKLGLIVRCSLDAVHANC